MNFKVEEIELKNGAKGLLIDIANTKAMHFNLSFRAGDYLCPKEKEQTAHVLEHMMFKANEVYHDQKILEDELSKNGANWNAFTSLTDIAYLANCANFEGERILKLLILMIEKPRFIKEDLKTEIKVVKEELTNYLNNYELILYQEISKVMVGIDSTPETAIKSLANINIEDVEDFYKRTHFVKNMRFLVVGDLSSKKEKIRRILEKIDLPKSNPERLENLKPPFPKINQAITHSCKAVSKFYFKFEIVRKPAFSLKEKVCLQIVCDLLTGSYSQNSLASRINNLARKRGLSYGISSYVFNDLSGNGGCFNIEGHVEKENAGPLFDLIAAEIKKVLNNELSQKEIEEIKKRLLGNHHIQELTPLTLMYYCEHYFIKDEPIDYDAQIDLLPSISRADILAAFKKIITEKHWYLGLLGSEMPAYKDDLYQKMATIFD